MHIKIFPPKNSHPHHDPHVRYLGPIKIPTHKQDKIKSLIFGFVPLLPSRLSSVQHKSLFCHHGRDGETASYSGRTIKLGGKYDRRTNDHWGKTKVIILPPPTSEKLSGGFFFLKKIELCFLFAFFHCLRIIVPPIFCGRLPELGDSNSLIAPLPLLPLLLSLLLPSPLYPPNPPSWSETSTNIIVFRFGAN